MQGFCSHLLASSAGLSEVRRYHLSFIHGWPEVHSRSCWEDYEKRQQKHLGQAPHAVGPSQCHSPLPTFVSGLLCVKSISTWSEKQMGREGVDPGEMKVVPQVGFLGAH